MKTHTKKSNPSFLHGFTLIEMIVVVAMVGILAVAGGTSYLGAMRSSRDARRKADLEHIRAALEASKSDNSSYPATLPTLAAPSKKYIVLPKDPSNSTLSYSYTTNHTLVGTATPTPPYTTYCLGTFLEVTPSASNCLADVCPGLLSTCKNLSGSNSTCNFCVDPYGKK